MSSDTASQIDQVELTVPLRTEFAATLRVLVASLGADAGFSIDEIDDFRLGLNEVFVMLAEAHAGSRASTTFRIAGRELAATIRTDPESGDIELDELGTNILRSVVDRFETGPEGVTLIKRAAETAGSHDPA
jgi:hypothetical protein